MPKGKKKTVGHAIDLIGAFLNDPEVVERYKKNKKFKDALKAWEYMKHLSGESLQCLSICNFFPSYKPF